MSERVFVARIPDCDLCAAEGRTVDAYADVRLPGIGSWANVCASHFLAYGCSLGTGHGQMLMTRKEIEEIADE